MNSLNNQGYANQGLAQSAMAGIGNSYLSAMGGARNQYSNEISGYNLAQAQQQEENNNLNLNNELESLSNYMQTSYDNSNGNRDSYINAMKAYGAVDENGNFKEDYLSRFEDYQQNALRGLQSQYLANEALSDEDFAQNVVNSLNIKNNGEQKIAKEDANTLIEIHNLIMDKGNEKAKDKFTSNLTSFATLGKNGDIMKVTYKGKDIYYIAYNGRAYVINKSLAENRKISKTVNLDR